MEPAKQHGGTGANQYTIKDMDSRGNNVTSASTDKAKRGNRADYFIARLKRDAATNPQAAALLGSIEAGDLKPYRAAVEMGWVKPPDPLATFLRYFSKQDRKARASIIQIILDCHGKD